MLHKECVIYCVMDIFTGYAGITKLMHQFLNN